jgi:peptidyl-prolyl cis-trans isomerase SurA
MRVREALTLGEMMWKRETMLQLGRLKPAMRTQNVVSGGSRSLALACCALALAGWAWVGVPAMQAQVVKAPRYQGGVEAPSLQLALPPAPAAITPHATVVEDVVARVNDQIITRSDVERAEQQLQQDAQQNHMSAGDLALAQRDMLRDMIDEQLLLSKAKELGLSADADVIRKLDEIRKQNHMDSLDDLKKAAEAQGVNYEDFKAQIRNGILKQKVVSEEVGRKLQLSDSEEATYYKEHEKEFERPEQVGLSEILVPLPDTATPAEIAQAQAKANELKTQVMKGGDFAEIAKKSSGGPTAAQGGELGLFKRGALAKVLEDDTFSLKVGETTQPIRTRQGFVILKVTKHDEAGPSPLKDVEPQIQEAIYMQQMQPALRAYLTKLREDSYVNLAPGFVDSGASGNESVPQFTAYVPPPVKKKKPQDTQRFGGNSRSQSATARNASAKKTTGATPVKATIDPKTGMAMVSGPKPALGKNGKPKKIKKEKVRFGQAPRTALQGGATDDAETTTPAGAAPGAVMASAGTSAASVTDTVAANSDTNLDDNPLNAKAPEGKKRRFAATEPVVKEKKLKKVEAKKEEKIVATAAPASAEEKADTKEQAAPLGLNGDTVAKAKQAKKDKKKRVKGAPKERLSEQPVVKPTPAPAPAPTANPKLAPVDVPTQPVTPPNSSTPKSVPNQSDTTLPPATQPTPGSPETGQPVPGTNPQN